MKLHQEITEILNAEPIPLTPSEIAERINQKNQYRRIENNDLSSLQIQSCILDFPSIFQSIGGRIILVSDRRWQDFLASYWYIVNILRSIFSNAELQYVIAALFLYRRLIDISDQYVVTLENEKSLTLHDIKNGYVTSLDWWQSLKIFDQENNFPLPIFSDLHSALRKLDKKTLDDVWEMLRRTNTTIFSPAEYVLAFEHLIEINVSENYRSDLIRTPPQIIELMSSILNPQSGTVYDPVCGIGGLLTEFRKRQSGEIKLKGNELNFSVAQLAFMNMILHGEKNPDIRAINCFTELASSATYEYIIGDLPLSTIPSSPSFHELAQQWHLHFPKEGKGFSAMLLFVVSKLSRRGKAVVTVSDSFLAAGGVDERLRRLLIEEDLIECVISLPANILKPYTNGKASILVLNKSKPSYLLDHVKFIDASTNKYKIHGVDTTKLVHDYRDRKTDGTHLQIVPTSRILEQSTLQVSFYTEGFHETEDLFREGKAVLLSELVEIRSGANLIQKDSAANTEGTPYVRIENLEKDILDMYLSSENLVNNIIDIMPYKRAYFSDEILMVARVGDYLKPTYFKPGRNLPSIITHANVISLKPLSKHSFSIEYLYYQLYSPFIQRQLEQKRKGAVMPFIGLKDLGKLVIPMMPLVAQQIFISSQKANIIASERERVNQRLKLVGFEEEGIRKESDIVSTLVHELRPKLVGINSIIEKIRRIVDKHGLSALTEYESIDEVIDPDLMEMIEAPENYNLVSLCEKLGKDSLHLNDTLSDVQKVMGFTLNSEDFLETDLLGFLNDYFSEKRIDIGNKFHFEIKGAHVKVELNRSSFTHVIDQLILNAQKHGFLDESPDYRIVFSVREDKDRRVAIIDYSNNGSPFALSEQEFIGFFHKSKGSDGSGIGGNFVYRVLKAHGGDLSIKENLKRGFSMKMEIPLNQEKYE